MPVNPIPMKPITGLASLWDFAPSTPDFGLKWRRATLPILYARRRPSHQVLKPVHQRSIWLVYFAYCPDDQVGIHQIFTLRRLKDMGFSVLIICASTSAHSVPPELHHYADALYWKGLSGYDFSAYTLAVEALSQHSTGATALILNDSMFGPFTDLRPFINSARWDLTGFTATKLNENHIQSYAFILRNIGPDRVADLRPVLHANKAFNNVDAVIWCQETRLASVAHRRMSVGSYVYCDGKTISDPCLQTPFALLDADFPFMKRSLLGKMQRFQDPEIVLQYLAAHDHPLSEGRK